MRVYGKLISLLVFLLVYGNALFAQISQGGTPPSFKFSGKEWGDVLKAKQIAVDFTREELIAKDAKNKDNYGTPPRLAIAIPVELNMDNSGEWTTLPDGQEIWRLRIKAENAIAIILSYKNLFIPEGAELFLYNAQHTQVIGAFTLETNPTGGAFSTEMIAGDDIILEYVAAKSSTEEYKPIISIDEVGYCYNYVNVKYLTNGKSDSKYGESSSCMININCSEGNDWQVEKRGVARMLMYITNGSSGTGWYYCSGTIINNTAQDLTPYLLSANHCLDAASAADLLKWQFLFGYESPTCEDANPTTTHTIVGAYLRATSPIKGGSDGLLIELASEIPSEWNVYYNGWDRRNIVTDGTGVGIHHPAGDIKKISTYNSYGTSTWPGENIGATDAHWLLTFVSTENGHSVTEGGSSGSPLFNANHLVIGTLTGGNSSCSNSNGSNYYGKLWYHWDQYGDSPDNQMKTWLDPLDLGVETLEGIDYNPTSPRVTIDKKKITFDGDVNTSTPADTIVVTGYNLTKEITAVTPSPFELSVDGINWSNSVNLPIAGGNLFARYSPGVIGNQSDTIVLSNSELKSDVLVFVSGSSCQEITFSSESLKNAEINQEYVDNIVASGNTAPYAFSITSGSLPTGLSMDENGKISGTPTESGFYNFTVMAIDQYGCSNSKDYRLCVVCFVISSYPYVEDFEEGNIPSCWTEEFMSGSASWICKTGGVTDGLPVSAHGGQMNACFSSSNYDKDVTKLITPQLDLTSLSNPVLSFWHAQAAWIADLDELRVYYKSSALGEWNLLATFTDDISEWKEEFVELPNPSSEYFIAFEGTSNYGYGVVLDDISIISPSISVNPTSVMFTNGVVGSSTDYQTISVTAENLAHEISAVTANPFSISTDGTTWNSESALSTSGGDLYVRFSPETNGAKTETIKLQSSGVTVTVELNGWITGIGDNDSDEQSTLLYPNPFSNVLNTSWTFTATELSIINAVGQEVYRTNLKGINSLSIPTSDWSKGIYFIKFLSTDYQRIYKVVKN
ncbi:MAG: putative Ig domain-containing protein [Bacteroidales bacterium]